MFFLHMFRPIFGNVEICLVFHKYIVNVDAQINLFEVLPDFLLSEQKKAKENTT